MRGRYLTEREVAAEIKRADACQQVLAAFEAIAPLGGADWRRCAAGAEEPPCVAQDGACARVLEQVFSPCRGPIAAIAAIRFVFPRVGVAGGLQYPESVLGSPFAAGELLSEPGDVLAVAASRLACQQYESVQEVDLLWCRLHSFLFGQAHAVLSEERRACVGRRKIREGDVAGLPALVVDADAGADDRVGREAALRPGLGLGWELGVVVGDEADRVVSDGCGSEPVVRWLRRPFPGCFQVGLMTREAVADRADLPDRERARLAVVAPLVVAAGRRFEEGPPAGLVCHLSSRGSAAAASAVALRRA